MINNQIPLSRKSFQKIIKFYLFECPVRTFKKTRKLETGRTVDQPHPKYNYTFKRVSQRGLTFEDRGLDGAKLNSLRAAMQRVTDVTLMAVDTEDEIKTNAKKIDGEYIIVKRNTENVSITESYFYCIRNAFAHGDFDVDAKNYCFRNETNGKVKGLAYLKESSLLSWIDLVDMSIDEIKKAGKM